MNAKGRTPAKLRTKTKAPNTCRIECPAIMLAKSRTERLIGRAM